MKFSLTNYLLTTFVLFTGCTINHRVLANQPSNITPSVWKTFSSSPGKFTILMPGIPQENKRTLKNKNGTVQVYTFMVLRPQEEVKYAVTYTEYPQEYINLLNQNNLVDTALNNGKNSALKKAQGTLVNETKITLKTSLKNYIGREIHYTKPGNKIVKLRIYLVNKRLYQIVAETTTKREKFLNKSISGFLNSFTILD